MLLKVISIVLKYALLPYWVFTAVSGYAMNTMGLPPIFVFPVSAAAVFGSFVVSMKLPF